MNNLQILAKVFKDQETIYGLKEFASIDLNSAIHIIEKDRSHFCIEDLKSGGYKDVFNEENQKGHPEEVIRQLWLYKLKHNYGYPLDRIQTEVSVHYGREIGPKRADIIIYKEDKITPYIIFELKEPKAKKAEDQLKAYMAGQWAEGGIWSNGITKFVLYRPHPKEYITSFPDIPRASETWDDLFNEKIVYSSLNKNFDLSDIINQLEEMVLAQSGESVFLEVFKLLYAKLYDENQAKNYRPDHEVLFKQYQDSKRTYQVINDLLFKSAVKKWENIFNSNDKIELSQDQLGVCVTFLQNIKLFGTGREELEIIDRAFEHLIADVSKGQK